MRRGDLITVALAGDFGKPRPALVIQADAFADIGTVTVLLVTATLVDAPLLRITVEPTAQNGLRRTSQVMVDKAMTVRRERMGSAIGRVDDATLLAVNRALVVFLGLA